jgi:AcrR family transcriptional regulator
MRARSGMTEADNVQPFDTPHAQFRVARFGLVRSHPAGTRRMMRDQATRQAIVGAARRLFSERGYFATKVEDIAAAARVAPATVYAMSGGKQGLLRTLTETVTIDPAIEAAIGRIEKLDDPSVILHLVAATVRSMREQFGDVVRVLLNTAPHDKAVCESLAIATTRYRNAFVPIARRLVDLGALREELELKQAVDVFWFYFGYSGLFTLHDENGWSYERAEGWLCREAGQALLRDHAPPSPGKCRP